MQLAIGSAVGLAVYVYNRTQLEDLTYLSNGGPRAEFVLNAAAMALRLGGASALRVLLANENLMYRIPVLAVNSKGEDIFGRPVPPEALRKAREALAASNGKAVPRGLRLVATPDGHVYLLFIPAHIGGKPLPPSRYPVADTLLIQLGVALCASLIFSLLLAWYLTRPVRLLQRSAKALAAGDLSARVSQAMGVRSDEIADLGHDFDYMADRLENMVNTQQRLMHDVSHELRSPLARMQVALALARQQPDKLEMALERIEREAARLDQLVGELLTLARLDAGVGMEAEEGIDLAALLETVVDDANFEASEERRVVLEYCDSGSLKGRRELLRRAFENVIRNALKYSPKGAEVTVRGERESGQFKVIVCDRGPGLPEDQLAAIFEPFVRAGDAPTGARSGYGLGLAITRRAVEAHGGSVKAENREGGGLCVRLSLPLPVVGKARQQNRDASPRLPARK